MEDFQYLREVVRDYAIQCGFELLVMRANNNVYTVTFSNEGCGWRLYVSRLPDGTTWAIKKIDNPENNCRAIETHTILSR